MIQFQENARTDRRTDRRMDRPYFIGPFRLPPGVQNRTNSSKGHFLLQTLGFLINKNKSVLHQCQTLQLLGVEINSKEMSVSLPQEKKDKIISQC